MGRQRLTCDFLSIDIRNWHRGGYLNSYAPFQCSTPGPDQARSSLLVRPHGHSVTLCYLDLTCQPVPCRRATTVHLDHTACHLGSHRPWFLCPAPGCGRRVAILYFEGSFRCRRCHGLSYRSQREPPGQRVIRAAEKVRERLGWRASIFAPNGSKPNGMRWRTYWRLYESYKQLEDRALFSLAIQFGIVSRQPIQPRTR